VTLFQLRRLYSKWWGKFVNDQLKERVQERVAVACFEVHGGCEGSRDTSRLEKPILVRFEFRHSGLPIMKQ
jgi:hypothetical protein